MNSHFKRVQREATRIEAQLAYFDLNKVSNMANWRGGWGKNEMKVQGANEKCVLKIGVHRIPN